MHAVRALCCAGSETCNNRLRALILLHDSAMRLVRRLQLMSRRWQMPPWASITWLSSSCVTCWHSRSWQASGQGGALHCQSVLLQRASARCLTHINKYSSHKWAKSLYTSMLTPQSEPWPVVCVVLRRRGASRSLCKLECSLHLPPAAFPVLAQPGVPPA